MKVEKTFFIKTHLIQYAASLSKECNQLNISSKHAVAELLINSVTGAIIIKYLRKDLPIIVGWNS
jgi:hypothetical protein